MFNEVICLNDDRVIKSFVSMKEADDYLEKLVTCVRSAIKQLQEAINQKLIVFPSSDYEYMEETLLDFIHTVDPGFKREHFYMGLIQYGIRYPIGD